LATLLFLNAASLLACPVCDSETGKAVRRGLFSPDFGTNLLLTVLPFPIFLAIIALLYYGPPAFIQRRPPDKADLKAPTR